MCGCNNGVLHEAQGGMYLFLPCASCQPKPKSCFLERYDRILQQLDKVEREEGA